MQQPWQQAHQHQLVSEMIHRQREFKSLRIAARLLVSGVLQSGIEHEAVEGLASPINRHPVTGQPVWFCNIHNHARYLRDRRPCTVPEVGMTEVFYGDLSPIPAEDLDHINEVSQKNIRDIPMQPGDVLLCDNYRVLHGRNVFKGDRYHAVSWFGGLVKDRPADFDDSNENSKPGDLLNKFVNKFLVDSF